METRKCRNCSPKMETLGSLSDINRKPTITFSEAYELRKKAEESRQWKRRREAAFSAIGSISDLDRVMDKIIVTIGNDNYKGVTKSVKYILSLVPKHLAKHVTEWQDSSHLDLLHHMIINNRPELLKFILSETEFFPSNHVPKNNPYVHLAAILGHTECLRTILYYRPEAYYRGEVLTHAISLPPPIMKKMKLSESVTNRPKSEKLLQKINKSKKVEEKKLKATAETDDEDLAQLKKDLSASEKKIMRSRRSRTPIVLHKDGKRSKEKVDKQKVDPKHPKKKSSYVPRYPGGLSEILRERKKREQPKHTITVFWNVLSNIEPGVVRGAGESVKVKYTRGAKDPRPHVDIDYKHFGDTAPLDTVSSGHSISTSVTGLVIKPVRKDPTEVKKSVSTSLEIGVRGRSKYKDPELKPPSDQYKDESDFFVKKTPLTYAADRGHVDCVHLILEMVIMKRFPALVSREPLALATKARSPEAIMLLLDKRNYSKADLQTAVMLAIREMYPDCLTALLSGRSRDRAGSGLDSTNLFHILYSQIVISGRRYELMPEMTRALISGKEDVNSYTVPRTYPMYTLINCAFNITDGQQIYFFIDCLNILLQHKANPHFDETKKGAGKTSRFCREPFSSALNCVFESAKASINFFEKSSWSKIFLNKFVMTLEQNDVTPRKVLNDALFDYMNVATTLGLDRFAVRHLLRYGSNPDAKRDGKYAVNVYFDNLFPYLRRFELIGSYDRYQQELDTVMTIGRAMSFGCLSDAMRIFLADHLLTAPIQALPITRQFASLMDKLMRTPRHLSELTAQAIWMMVRRNENKLKQLPIPHAYIQLILP